MVDFDHVVAYDPALDCGVLLAHWMWMGLKNAKLKIKDKKFQEDFWKTYRGEFKNRGLGGEVEHILKRTMRWAGIYLVSRTDGRSGSYFKKWPRWEKTIRQLGIELFTKK